MIPLASTVCMAYPEGAPHDITLAMGPSNGSTPNLVEAGLYQVILTRQFRRGRYNHLSTPIVSMYYCIAQSEEDAIAQVDGNALPDDEYTTQAKMGVELIEQRATRIPVHVRGWGRRTF